MVQTLLKNISGKGLTSYTRDTSHMSDSYPYTLIEYQLSNAITEEQAKAYMRSILGVTWLPQYDYAWPKNIYIIDGSGIVWKPQWTDVLGTYELRMYYVTKITTDLTLSSGTNNGTLKLVRNGVTTDNIAVKGLGSAAYTDLTDYVAKNTSITGATKTKISYDSKGLVTAGADATLDDIPDGLTRKLSDYSLSTHNHNTTYAPLSHVHTIGYYSTASASDLNTTVGTGQFSWNNTSTNTPVEGSYGQGINIVSSGTAHNYSNNWITQLAFSRATNAAYFRGKVNNQLWQPWYTLYHTGNKPTATDVGLGNVTNESKTTMFTSPTFTGTPLSVTATKGTNTTQIATTAFVQTAIGDYVPTTRKVNGKTLSDNITLSLDDVNNGTITGALNFSNFLPTCSINPTTDSQFTNRAYVDTALMDAVLGDLTIIYPITWSQLKAKRDSGTLKPGLTYRIIDYITTTAQADTQSANHAFDIIVVADSPIKLNEDARVVHSEGDTILKGITASIATAFGEAGDVLKRANDNVNGPYAWGTDADISDGDSSNFVYTDSATPSAGDEAWSDDGDYGVVVSRIEEEDYFANSKLESWKIKYCLDNDTSRFAWALDKTIKVIKCYENPGDVYIHIRCPEEDVDGKFAWAFTSVSSSRDLDSFSIAELLDDVDRTDLGFTSTEEIIPGETIFEYYGYSSPVIDYIEIAGKGVIYRMIDEFNNDCPYDFKNIRFLVSDEYLYTFNYYAAYEDEEYDLSLNQYMLFDFLHRQNTTTEIGCHTNIIKPYYNQTDGTDLGHGHLQFLNFIIF